MNKVLFKEFIFFTLLFWVVNSGFTQNSKQIDDLIQKAKECKNDSVKVSYLNELAWLYRNSQPDSALMFAQTAMSIAKRNDFNHEQATSLNRIGEAQKNKGEYNEAVKTFNKALNIEREIGHNYGIARASGQLTILYRMTGQTEKAFDVGKKCIDLYKELNNQPALANAYDRYATLHRYQGNLDSAIKFVYSALNIREELNDTVNLIYSFMNLSHLYIELENFDKALEYNLKAKEMSVRLNDLSRLAEIYTTTGVIYQNLKQYDTAVSYNLKSIDIKQSFDKNFATSTNYHNLGNCYTQLGEYAKAIQCYNRSVELQETSNKIERLATTYNNLGNLHFIQKNYKKSLSYYKKGLEIAKINNDKLITLELYHNLYKVLSITNKLENAIAFGNQYIALRDSIEKDYRNTINLKERYEEERRRNQLLEKDNVINEIRLRRKNILVVSLTIGLFLVLLLFFAFFYNNRLKQRTLLAEKNNHLNEKKISRLLKDLEIKSMSALLQGQEGERKRIAQDLHDRLGSMLAMVKVHFKSVEENIESVKENNRLIYSKANNLLDEACEEVRKISNDLVSGVLNKFGLLPALNDLKNSIVETGQLKIDVFNFGFDENRLDYDIEINLYRIIQELISNILKHSKASEVSIQLLKKDNRLNVVVEDNGIGFNVSELNSSKGMGLKNIESRVDSLHGKYDIDSGKGAGTTITIDIPLNQTL